MYFNRDEKVFSLAGTSSALQRMDLQITWQEFFAYLIVAGLYNEGQGYSGNKESTRISLPKFQLPSGTYVYKLGTTIASGLSQRWYVLYNHHDTTPTEKSFLENLDELFVKDGASYRLLKAKTFLDIAANRELSETGKVLAHYASVMFGQRDFAEPTKLPGLYLSRFGNIHLSKHDTHTVGEPHLVYGKVIQGKGTVTALWALVSSQVTAAGEDELAVEWVIEWLSQLVFLCDVYPFCNGVVTFPQAAASAFAASRLGLHSGVRNELVTKFYHELVWHGRGKITITNHALFKICLDLMIPQERDAEWIGDYISADYRRLLNPTVAVGENEQLRLTQLDMALEALGAETEDEEKEEGDAPESETPSESEVTASDEGEDGDTATGVDVPDTDPEHDPSSPADGEFDPSVPPPAVPAQEGEGKKDTIGLISFDTTGEGVNADLYRTAVLALHKRLLSDDSVPVTAEVKDALNYWVNSFLYRAAISATQDRMAALGLQKYLKNVATKG